MAAAVAVNCSAVAKSLATVPSNVALAELTSKKQLATSTVPAESKAAFPATLAVPSTVWIRKWQLL